LCRPFGVDGPEPLASRLHMFAGTVRHLTHRRRGFADRAGDLVVIEAEHLAQDQHRALIRSERLQQNQHRHRNALGESDIGGGVAFVE